MHRYTVAYGADYKRRATFYTIWHAEQFLRALVLNGTPAKLI